MPEHTGRKTKKPVGLGKHSPKQHKKTDKQGIDNENEPATCASFDESWQAHQGPSFEWMGKSKLKLLPAGTEGQAPERQSDSELLWPSTF